LIIRKSNPERRACGVAQKEAPFRSSRGSVGANGCGRSASAKATTSRAPEEAANDLGDIIGAGQGNKQILQLLEGIGSAIIRAGSEFCKSAPARWRARGR
jgi:hypothetical protein